MQNLINSITQQLFHKDTLDEVSDEELDKFLSEYPYAAPVRFLAAKKKQDADPGNVNAELLTAGLFFHNPLWLEWQLREPENVKEQAPEKTMEIKNEASHQEPVAEEQPKQEAAPDSTDNDAPIVFQSYHTIDYFASQGIRLQQAELTKDRLGQQLKSFTEWLRSMKKLPSSEAEAPAGEEDDNRRQYVIKSAQHSIEEKEVVTETMAEVWAKQGNREKAMEIYQKLSLQNPGKSAYFAAKIDQLK